MLETILLGLTALGLVVVLAAFTFFAIRLIQGIRAHLVLNTLPFTTKYGSWAVVTGSTDGIGRAYAFELAKRGVNIVLISRSQDKLDRVAEEIQKNYLVQTKTIAADFSEGKDIYTRLEKELDGIQIGILVNNVGKQYEYPMYLGEVPEKELWDIININIGATTTMTRLVLPQMLERGRGAIVNVSSGSESQPLPLMTVYAASKTFIKSFTLALRCEYGRQGITVQHLSPWYVSTKMNAFSDRFKQTSWMVPDAETYAASAVNTLGRLDSSTGYWGHGIQAFFVSFVPVAVRTNVGMMMNQLFRNDYKSKKKTVD